MLRKHKYLKPIADTLFSLLSSPSECRQRYSIARSLTHVRIALDNGLLLVGGGYYEAETKVVAERYLSLSGAEQDIFVPRRQAYVKTMKEVVFESPHYSHEH